MLLAQCFRVALARQRVHKMLMFEIVVGVFTAALLIHFRGAYLHARKQRLIAVRLASYLAHWKERIVESEFFAIFYVGMEWHEEIQEIVAKGGSAQELIALGKEKKEIVEGLKKEILSGITDVSIDNDELLRKLRKYSLDDASALRALARQDDQDLLDAKTFISDEDASYLPPYIAQRCVSPKMNMISARSDLVSLLLEFLAEPSTFTYKDYADTVGDITWQAFVISRDTEVLLSWTDLTSRRSIIRHAIDNL